MVEETSVRVEQLITELYREQYIDEMTKKWLCQTQNPPGIPVFYTLTKIHKPTPVGRPIISTGGDNSNKRCLSNTRSQLKSSRKFGSSSRILGIHSRMSRFFSPMSRNYRVFPGKISKCPDSRRNLQIPGTILALSRNSVC